MGKYEKLLAAVKREHSTKHKQAPKYTVKERKLGFFLQAISYVDQSFTTFTAHPAYCNYLPISAKTEACRDNTDMNLCWFIISAVGLTRDVFLGSVRARLG